MNHLIAYFRLDHESKSHSNEGMISYMRIQAAVVIGITAVGFIANSYLCASNIQGRLSLEKLVVALKPDKNPDRMLDEKRNLSDCLKEYLEQEIEVMIPLSSAVIIEGFANGTIDIGYLSSTGTSKAIERGVADVLLAGEIDGKPYYMSYWIALKDSPYTRVEDLRGKPIAFSSRTSTSGFIIPTWDLYKKGLIELMGHPENFFGKGNIYYGVGYVSAANRVLEGQSEAAAVSYYVLDKDKHLSVDERSRLKIIASQGPVPSHIIAIRKSIIPEDRSLIKQALLAMNTHHPDLRDRVFTSRLIEVDADTHLAPIREALSLISRINH